MQTAFCLQLLAFLLSQMLKLLRIAYILVVFVSLVVSKGFSYFNLLRNSCLQTPNLYLFLI